MEDAKKRPGKRQRLSNSTAENSDEVCCVKVSAEANSEGFSLEDDAPLLPQLLSPLDSSVFIEHYFRKCAVHVQGNSPTRFDNVLNEFLSNPSQIFEQTASENIFVWLQVPLGNPKGSGKKRKSLIHSMEVEDAETALALHQAGHSTYCRAPPPLEQALVQALLTDTNLGGGGGEPRRGVAINESFVRGEVECFLSRNAGQVTSWHTDFQENFTLQLSGRKRWRLQKSTLRHPLRGCTPHYRAPDVVEGQLKAGRLSDEEFTFAPPPENIEGPADTVVLEPGDVLYHPAGVWHQVEVLEPGVSINISLMAMNYAQLTCQSLQQYLLRRSEWRECVTTGDRLSTLLENLPAMVREFCLEVGTPAILPPVLQNSKCKSDSSKFQGSDGADDEETDEISDEESSVVDGDSFSCSNSAVEFRKLAVSPLALLLDERKDIQSYYQSGEEATASLDSDICVLNVNYAGNETHESLVRVRIRSLHWKDVLPWSAKQTTAIDRAAPLVECLAHYGYLIPTERSSQV